MLKKILLIGAAVLFVLVGLFVLTTGPWPVYGSSDVTQTKYYRKNIAAIESGGRGFTLSGEPEHLWAGWSKRKITPETGVPLGGLSARDGNPSTGVHDDVYVKALSLFDGDDRAVIVAADMLIIPENLADMVKESVAKQSDILPSQILFTASHSHSSVGAWGPGFAGEQSAGKYDEKVVRRLAELFTEAIIEARDTSQAAAFAHGSEQVGDYVTNRARAGAPTDNKLGFAVVEKADGERCYLVRYSAHATILGADNMEFSGDYPGYLQRAIERKTGGFAMFLGGAMGSMRPNPPSGEDGFKKAEAMGEALAAVVLEKSKGLTLSKTQEVASIGFPMALPSYQFRVTKSWRLSPFLLRMMGVDGDAWLGGVRVGDLFLVGTPCDFCGEIAVDLDQWAKDAERDLWVLSFNGDYVGYVSPDKYYDQAENKGTEGYEVYTMSWCGPNQEALFTGLIKHTVDTLVNPVSAGQ